jgi:hypothetical protein
MTHDRQNQQPEQQAWESEIKDLMKGLGMEKAPPGLRRRLRRIPREQRSGPREAWWQPPRWAMAPALAVVPLLVITIVMLQPRQPSQAEVEQARQDLALAFAYLDRAGSRTGNEIQRALDESLGVTVKDNLSRNIPFTEQFRKEESS